MHKGHLPPLPRKRDANTGGPMPGYRLVDSALSFRQARCVRERKTDDKALAILMRYMVAVRTVLNTPDIYASSEARHGDMTRVSGQRPEQGADAVFFAQQKTWAQGPYPAQ
jgi:hypothetical protein